MADSHQLLTLTHIRVGNQAVLPGSGTRTGST